MQTQHEELLLAQRRILQLEARVDSLVSQNNALQDKLRESKQDIENLYAENDRLIHTPQFAADTQSALDRGRRDGVRSLSNRVLLDILSMLNDMYREMENIANRYTRNLAMDIFTDTIAQAGEVKTLPRTEFSESLIAAAEKV